MPEPQNTTEITLSVLLAAAAKRFQPGKLVCTSLVKDTFSMGWVTKCYCRHLVGDWGDLDNEDLEANESALQQKGRLLSHYIHSDTKERIYIITEHDRSVTTILLPMEY